MKIFDFDPARYSEAFARQGYVHIKRGLSEEFFTLLSAQVRESMQTGFMAGFALGDKQQALFKFPPSDFPYAEILKTVGEVCGIDPRELIISERHIKAYNSDAKPQPVPHKDRFASQIAVGFPISVARDSALILYPHDDVGANPFDSRAELRAALPSDRRPEKVLEMAARVEIKDAPRDVLIFRGSATWHLRSNPTGAITLYIKLNSYNCDPLGEDPMTSEYLKQVADPYLLTDNEIEEMTPRIGRGVDSIQKRYSRDWKEFIVVAIRGKPLLAIDEEEFKLLSAVDGRHTIRAIRVRCKAGANAENGIAKIRRLAASGIIDLLKGL